MRLFGGLVRDGRLVALLAAGVLFGWAGDLESQVITDLDDIEFWVGSGSNRAGLVIGFDDGATQDAFSWGYRWDGTASGAEMLVAIADSDPRLSILFSGTVEENFFLQTLEYDDRNGDNHFAASFGYFAVGGTGSGTPIAGAGSAVPTAWNLSPSGASASNIFEGTEYGGRLLGNESWDGWFAGDFPPPDFIFSGDTSGPYYAAIPEPGAIFLLLTGLALFLVFRRRLCRRREGS